MDNTKYVQLIGRCELRKVLFCASKDMDGAQHEGECESAIADLLARTEAAEQKVNELERVLSDASKIVNTMQESTIPFYRKCRKAPAFRHGECQRSQSEAAKDIGDYHGNVYRSCKSNGRQKVKGHRFIYVACGGELEGRNKSED